jgi:hypothetical protein
MVRCIEKYRPKAENGRESEVMCAVNGSVFSWY